jgi:glycosyltransferase involved in cell wall biosynthesis
MDVSIIVPVFNEEESLFPLHRSIRQAMSGLAVTFEILLVNDGSTDHSTSLLNQLAEDDPQVRVIHLRRNFGQTAAMSAGFDHARGDAIVTLDADLQNDPQDIPQMLRKLAEGYDLVHGWRRKREDAFLNRRLPSKLANWLIAKVTGFPVRDLGCTLKVMRKEIATDLKLYGEMHRFIPILAHWQGARCVEMETRHHPRRFGKTKYGLSRTFRVLLDLVTVKFLIQYSTSPMRLFGMIGFGCAAMATLTGIAVLLMKATMGFDMSGNPLLYVALFGLLLGLQFFSLGMLGEMNARIYYESQGRRPYTIRGIVSGPSRDDVGTRGRRAA